MNLKENISQEINGLDRKGEFWDTLYEWHFERILKDSQENLFNLLVGNTKLFGSLCLRKFRQINTYYYFKPLLTLADNVFDDDNDGALIDDIMIRLNAVPVSKYFYDNHWSLNFNVQKHMDNVIKLISDRLTKEMYEVLGDDFFKTFEKKGYAISIDKNYCNSNFDLSQVNYCYSDTGCNANFSNLHFESLVLRIDRIELIKERFKNNNYVMNFHKDRYRLK